MSKTKTNINLIVNGTKVYTRKTTGRPYTHALVAGRPCGKWEIVSCSSTGATRMQREVEKWASHRAEQAAYVAQGAEAYARRFWTRGKTPTADMLEGFDRLAAEITNNNAVFAATRYLILPIIDNTVTVTD